MLQPKNRDPKPENGKKTEYRNPAPETRDPKQVKNQWRSLNLNHETGEKPMAEPRILLRSPRDAGQCLPQPSTLNPQPSTLNLTR
jgi:hypothetical protein